MNMGMKNLLRMVSSCVLALAIPALLFLNGMQSRKFRALKAEVLELEKKQQKLVEDNKKLITQISVLSSSDRIESIAENDLGMRRAQSDEIVRVEMRR